MLNVRLNKSAWYVPLMRFACEVSLLALGLTTLLSNETVYMWRAGWIRFGTSPCMSWYCSLLAGLSPSLSLPRAAHCSHSSTEEVPRVALLRPDSPTDRVRGIALMPGALSAWVVLACFHCSGCKHRDILKRLLMCIKQSPPQTVFAGWPVCQMLSLPGQRPAASLLLLQQKHTVCAGTYILIWPD